MQLSSSSFSDGQAIPGDFAFCIPDPDTHATFAPNRSPALTWDGPPEGTRTYVLVCHDPDVPTKPDDVNQEGREVPPDLPRTNFYHWVLVDLPTHVGSIADGEVSNGVTERGKPPTGPYGARPGVNNYTDWFSGDPHMEGIYHGYDGPCPPWNDSLVHHYVFTVFATDLERCPVDGDFGGPDVLAAIDGHVLAEASITGTYTLNPRLM
jgi:Raf kinase inhibitor-like YbhB/YbcL family protein